MRSQRAVWPQGQHGSLDLDELRAFTDQSEDSGESRVAVDTNAITAERQLGLSLPIEDGGGQQLSYRCF